MALPRKIKNYNAFVDGRSYFGRSTEAKLPQPKIQTEGHRGSGMDAPVGIDMGMEGLTAELTMADWAPELITMLGTINRMVLRPVADGAGDEVEADSYIATIGGLWTAVEFGDLKPGTDTPLKLICDTRYFRLVRNGAELIEIDIPNGKRVIGGVDQMRGMRRAMGF
jgi:P2 family phage contractile tail tube protein